MTAKSIAIIGAGPAGLTAAERLAGQGHSVTVFDRMPSLARKLLMAGRGGLNLTHSELFPDFLKRYGAAEKFLRPALEAFPPEAVIAWCEGLGQETFAGSSGRVFPKAMKASPLLRAWLRRLGGLGVRFMPGHRWLGWEGGALAFAAGGSRAAFAADATILALGGASWPRLGSDGAWTEVLRARGVALSDFQPSNCGFEVNWSEFMRERHAGAALKRISVSIGDVSRMGEASIARYGIEGGAVYAVSAALRGALARASPATLLLDLRPGLPADELARQLSLPRKGQSIANVLRKAGLSPQAIALLREAGSGALPGDPRALAELVKSVPLTIQRPRGLERAISTAGGVAWDAVNERFMLKSVPGVFAAGEMLDWEAPTGGYLLQACFSTGAAAAEGAAEWLSR